MPGLLGNDAVLLSISARVQALGTLCVAHATSASKLVAVNTVLGHYFAGPQVAPTPTPVRDYAQGY